MGVGYNRHGWIDGWMDGWLAKKWGFLLLVLKLSATAAAVEDSTNRGRER